MPHPHKGHVMLVSFHSEASMSTRHKVGHIVLVPLLALGLPFLAGGETKGHAYTAQSVPETRARKLLPLVNSFHSFSQDFLQMASSRKGDPEFELLIDLHNTAETVTQRLSADYAMISMYEDIQCNEDRGRVRHYVSERFDYEGKLIDSDIGAVNNMLALSRIPAAAQLGIQMKNDLRAAKEKLDSIVASLE